MASTVRFIHSNIFIDHSYDAKWVDCSLRVNSLIPSHLIRLQAIYVIHIVVTFKWCACFHCVQIQERIHWIKKEIPRKDPITERSFLVITSSCSVYSPFLLFGLVIIHFMQRASVCRRKTTHTNFTLARARTFHVHSWGRGSDWSRTADFQSVLQSCSLPFHLPIMKNLHFKDYFWVSATFSSCLLRHY